jgi:predicted RNA-binding protein YlxR (DUF448 family)
VKPKPVGRLQTTNTAPHLETTDAADDEDAPEETGPLRRCIVTRTQGERGQMIRFVLAPDRSVVPDLAARLPGRGMWLSPRADVVETARVHGQLSRAFARAARGPVNVPADLVDVLQAGLTRRVIDHLGLARRAGQAVAGYAKLREWLASGQVGLVIQASDGSEDERRRALSGSKDIGVAWPLDGAALGAIFGRDYTVHVAVAKGRLADVLNNEILRLSGMSGRAMTKQDGG